METRASLLGHDPLGEVLLWTYRPGAQEGVIV